MHSMPLWRYEIRRAGWPAPAGPVAMVSLTVAGAVLTERWGSPDQQVARLLLTGLEALVPLAAGMAAATVVATDRCRELQLSVPTSYALTLGRRLGIVLVAGALVSGLFSVGLWLAGWWSGPEAPAAALVWAAPLVWLVGLGALVAVLARSVVLATSVLGALWMAEQLYAELIYSRDWTRPLLLFMTTRVGVTPDWAANRAVLAASGALLLAAALLVVALRSSRPVTDEEA